jgi:hypothetical protein
MYDSAIAYRNFFNYSFARPSASSLCKYLSRPLLIRTLRHARLKRSAVILVTAGPNSAELAAYCRERGLFLGQGGASVRWLKVPTHSC